MFIFLIEESREQTLVELVEDSEQSYESPSPHRGELPLFSNCQRLRGGVQDCSSEPHKPKGHICKC